MTWRVLIAPRWQRAISVIALAREELPAFAEEVGSCSSVDRKETCATLFVSGLAFSSSVFSGVPLVVIPAPSDRYDGGGAGAKLTAPAAMNGASEIVVHNIRHSHMHAR